MHLTRLYGQKAINIQDGRLQFFAKNGVIDVPQHLVRRVIEQGFSLTPFADVAVPSEQTEAPPEPTSTASTTTATPETAKAPDSIAKQPATQSAPLPPGHPQVATIEQLRAAEEKRLRPAKTDS